MSNPEVDIETHRKNIPGTMLGNAVVSSDEIPYCPCQSEMFLSKTCYPVRSTRHWCPQYISESREFEDPIAIAYAISLIRR